MALGRTEDHLPRLGEKRVYSEVAMLAIDDKLLWVIKIKVDCKDLEKALTVVRQ